MEATVKFVKEHVTFPNIVEGKRVEVIEEINVVHVIINGEDKGEVINVHADWYNEGDEINVEYFDVCPHCLDMDGVEHNCMCWYENYKPIKVLKAVCKCCGKEI